MPTSESFVVSKKTKKLLHKSGNSFDYWRGKKKGTIDCEIEIFTTSEHRKEAEEILKILKEKKLLEKFFSIKVEIKSMIT